MNVRIAFFGSSLLSSYWNGAATYYRGLIRALHEAGARVTFYEPDAFERQRHIDLEKPDWAEVVVYEPREEAVLRIFEGLRADFVVKASGVGVLDAWLERSVLELQSPSRRVIFWDVDAPATLSRVESDAADPFRAWIPRYDLILTYGGGPPVVRRYEALGARRCVPVYNALDPRSHHPAPPDPRYEADLSFLGNRLPDREARVDRFFFEAARRLPERSFLLGGSGWEAPRLPRNVRHLGHVPTTEHNAFNASAAAVLNVNRDSMAETGWSPATRVFEAAGAGACILTDPWTGIEEFLEPGREILVASSGEEVADLVRFLTPERSAAIGRAAMRRVLAEHTYERRVETLRHVLEEAR